MRAVTRNSNEQRPQADSRRLAAEELDAPGLVARFWRNRIFARIRHYTNWHPVGAMTARNHARLILLSGGRIRRSFFFTGGMPILVLTTTGRISGKSRSTPLGFLPFDGGFAVIASNAGSARTPAWWLNLQAHPMANVLVDRRWRTVRARRATDAEDQSLWSTFARLNPGFDEYRKLTTRKLPVVILERV